MKFKDFKEKNLRFLPTKESSLVEDIFNFLLDNKNELISAIRDHKRPPLEGVLFRLVEKYSSTFDVVIKKDNAEFRRVKQCIGKMVSFIVEAEGYVPDKYNRRVGLRNAVNEGKYFTSSGLYEKEEVNRNEKKNK